MVHLATDLTSSNHCTALHGCWLLSSRLAHWACGKDMVTRSAACRRQATSSAFWTQQHRPGQAQVRTGCSERGRPFGSDASEEQVSGSANLTSPTLCAQRCTQGSIPVNALGSFCFLLLVQRFQRFRFWLIMLHAHKLILHIQGRLGIPLDTHTHTPCPAAATSYRGRLPCSVIAQPPGPNFGGEQKEELWIHPPLAHCGDATLGSAKSCTVP